MTRIFHELNLEAARALTSSALDYAATHGYLVCALVMDAHGHVITMSRMDRARWLGPELARGKALPSVHFRRSTGEIEKMAEEKPAFYMSLSLMQAGPFAVSRGGLPIWIGPEVVGAIGVSGTSAGRDEECALAALKEHGFPVDTPPEGQLALQGLSFDKEQPGA